MGSHITIIAAACYSLAYISFTFATALWLGPRLAEVRV